MFDALTAAGGVDKLGSLRDIRLIRSGARPIDFYGLLQGIDGTDPALRDGDRIVVPPIGPTIAIAGQVKRPAIFELPADRRPIPLEEAIALGRAGSAGTDKVRSLHDLPRKAPRFRSKRVIPMTMAGNSASPMAICCWCRRPHDVRVGSVAITGHVQPSGATRPG